MTPRRSLVLALLLFGGARAEAQVRREVPPPPGERSPRTVPPPKSPTGRAAPQRAGEKPRQVLPPRTRGEAPRVVPPPAGRADTPPRHVAPPRVAPPATTDTIRPAGAETRANGLSVTLITYGVGQEVWERFGHNALWIHDEQSGRDVAYNWGLFDFDQPDFLERFLTGDTKYWMAGEDPITMLAAYHDLGRPITLQTLNLTPAQAAALRDFVEWNASEENKFYRYDYYRDNCSTRLRDALDRAVGGALRRATDTIRTPLTYRSESVRLTDGDLPVQAGVDVALGQRADVPLTAWESFFIPMRLRDAVRRVDVPGADGKMIPLVAEERVIPPSPGTRTFEEATVPPDLTWRALIAGLVLASIVVGLRFSMRTHRVAAWLLALFSAVWSLLGGTIGAVLVLAWVATKHFFWGMNENLLLLSPLWLVLAIALPAAFLASRARTARVLTWLHALLGLVALVLAIRPGGQQNLTVVALFLPVHLALAWAVSLRLPPRAEPARK